MHGSEAFPRRLTSVSPMAAAPGLHAFDAAAEMAAAGDDPARREAALMNILN